MAYAVQQIDIENILQPTRIIFAKVELLNNKFVIVDKLEGELKSDDFSIDSESDMRRTCKLSFVVKDSTFSINRDSKIWLDKYLRLSVGIKNIRDGNIYWYPLGIYVINSSDYEFDPLTRLLSLSCTDRVAELNGIRNGQLSGISSSIPAYTSDSQGKENMIYSALSSTISQLGKIQKFIIDDIGKPVPYNLEFGTGAVVWDIIKALRDLYPGWEAFFDNEYFIYREMPTYESDPIVLDAETINKLLISDNTLIDFSSIKNVTEVWGKCIESNHYTVNTSYDVSGNFILNYSSVSELNSGDKFGFKAPISNKKSINIKINNFSSYPLLIEGNDSIHENQMVSGQSYVIRFHNLGVNSYFNYLGEYQICAVTKLVSKYPSTEIINYDIENEPTRNISYIVQDSLFCSDYEDVGEIRQVLSGGEYDNIASEGLATQRAEYENWKTTDLKDSITLDMIDIPWLDVNQKIEYVSPITGKKNIYLVKTKKSSMVKGVMTIGCVKFQPLYPWYTSRKVI